MLLRLSIVLSPVTGLFCHRRFMESYSAILDTSIGVSGPHDFAVRFSFARPRATGSHDAAAGIAPAVAVSSIAHTPLL